MRHASANHICPVLAFASAQNNGIVNCGIGSHDDSSGGDDVTVSRGDSRRSSAAYFVRMRVGIDVSITPQRSAYETFDVFEWIKLSLPGKSQTTARIEIVDWRTINPLHALKSSPSSSRDLLLENIPRAVGRNEEKAVDTIEVAVDLLIASDLLDPVNRRRVTFSDQPRAALSEQTFDFVVTIVEGV